MARLLIMPALLTRRGWKPLWQAILGCLLGSGLAWCPSTGSTATVPTPEYQVKAVFLFNFTQFVEWPQDAFASAKAPLVIGVLGEDPFGTYLEEAVRGETAHGRPLAVARYRRLEEVRDCQVLFVSRSEADRLPQILASLNGKGVLTVGDVDGFARQGGMIRLATVAGKIHLRINLDAAKAARLTISSKLLRPAEIEGAGS